MAGLRRVLRSLTMTGVAARFAGSEHPHFVRSRQLMPIETGRAPAAAPPRFRLAPRSRRISRTRRILTLTGELTKIEWTNPHSHIYLDVKDDDGNVVNWQLEEPS
jgi:hypothetical protein